MVHLGVYDVYTATTTTHSVRVDDLLFCTHMRHETSFPHSILYSGTCGCSHTKQRLCNHTLSKLVEMTMHQLYQLYIAHTSLAACLMTSLADALHIAGTVSTHLMSSLA